MTITYPPNKILYSHVRLLKSFDGVVEYIGLNVKKDNHIALQLYEKLGFAVHSIYKEAYFERIL